MTDHERAIHIRDRVRPSIDAHGWRSDENRRYTREPLTFVWRDQEPGVRPNLLGVWKTPGGKMMSLEWVDDDCGTLICFRHGDWADGLDWLLL